MATNSRSGSRSIERSINVIISSPWLWGTVATFAFYCGLPYLPLYHHGLKRYFNATWIENAETGMFFIGMCTLIGKRIRISAERGALEVGLLDGLALDSRDGAVSCAAKIDAHLNLVDGQRSDTKFLKRVRHACEYVAGRQSSEGLEGYLNSLAEISLGRMRSGYSLVRTMACAIPILGFLGTVIGITAAIANINPAKLETSLPKVTAGLATAFDATVLALPLAMVLVFGIFIVEQAERQTLEDIEDQSAKQLRGLFLSIPADPASPLKLAEQQAAEQLLTQCEGMIARQMEMWQTSLESLRERWSNTLSKQQGFLDQAFQTGLTNAIADHSHQLTESRSEFLTAFRATSESIGQQLAQSSSFLAEHQQRGCEQISQTWQQFRTEITKTRDEHARQLALLTQVITAEVGGWQNQLESSTQSMTLQLGELRTQGNVFLKLTESQTELVRLERRLAENLEAVRVVESLEDTLLNLNAAVHLLTTRVKSSKAA